MDGVPQPVGRVRQEYRQLDCAARRQRLRSEDAGAAEQAATQAWRAVLADLGRLREKQSRLRPLADDLYQRAARVLDASLSPDQREAVAAVDAWRPAAFDGATRLKDVDKGDDEVAPRVALSAHIGEACRGEGTRPEVCPETMAEAWQLALRIGYAHRIASTGARVWLAQYAAYLRDLDEAWTAFLTGGKPMFPTDLAATDWLYRRFSKDYRDPSGGFRAPPETQYFVLHPIPGFEFAFDDAFAGERLREAVAVEVLGFNRWRSKHVSGFGLVVDWVDRAGTEELGYGFQVTWNSKYTLCATVHDEKDYAVLLGVDLAHFVTDRLLPKVAEIRAAP